MKPLLRVHGLHAGYGASSVLRDIDFEISAGSVFCVLGRNGAGKTTLLRALMGVVDKQGRVDLAGNDITHWSSHRINRAGMVLVPQDDSVFSGLTVREHLTIARRSNQVEHGIRAAADLFPVLGDRLEQEAQTLSGGERKMLAIAQALISEPQVILMDEPTEGVAPVVVDELIPAIQRLAQHAAVVLVEQNIDTAVMLGDDSVVLEHGRVAESGKIGQLYEDGILEERLAL